MSKVRILYLEADEADAESIGSLVNIVREVQSGRVVAATSVAELPAPATEAPPLALPSPSKTAPRRVSSVHAAAGPRKCRNCGQPGHRSDKCPKRPS